MTCAGKLMYSKDDQLKQKHAHKQLDTLQAQCIAVET